jgi:hypothetical protein
MMVYSGRYSPFRPSAITRSGNPHIHAIVADGLFRRNGVFYVMPKTGLKPLAELFRARLLKLLVKEGAINPSAFLLRYGETAPQEYLLCGT